ncbi:MAG: hypothetical protein ABSE63_02450 [Thermoguttaceae bacterium]|jgi:hypothetical protein
MIPEFDARGYLPPGIHRATLEEIEQRFGRQSELRRVQMESLCWLVDMIRGTKIKRFIINGSFATDEFEPNDVDCVLLIDEDVYLDDDKIQILLDGLPFLDIQIVKQNRFNYLVEKFFATDRRKTPKGMLEVIL